VAQLQRRLRELGYWIGAVSGSFGADTTHAVIALQKVAGHARDGVVDAAAWAALDAGVRPAPRTSRGHVAEVNRGAQLLLLVRDGHIEWVFDASTGRSGLATPAGTFSIYKGVASGTVDGAYRPKYFYAPRALAIHGYASVPTYPASHGCVRVTFGAMDWLWSTNQLPVGTPVLVY
jgi:hypothetical protein